MLDQRDFSWEVELSGKCRAPFTIFVNNRLDNLSKFNELDKKILVRNMFMTGSTLKGTFAITILNFLFY